MSRYLPKILWLLLCLGLPVLPNCLTAAEAIPVRNIGHGLLVAPVYLNGQGPFQFVLDTGTNTTLLTPALAVRLGLIAQGHDELQTLTGPARVSLYRLETVAVGSHLLRGLPALAQPLGALQSLDPHIDGILGLGFLAHFSFGLDYAHRTLLLDDSGQPLILQGGTIVPARLEDERLLVTVASPASPERSWTLALDSGIANVFLFADPHSKASAPSSGTDNCSPAASEDSPRLGTPHTCSPYAATVRVATNHSETLAESVILPSLLVGTLRLRNVRVVVLPPPNSAADVAGDGLLPACLFRSVVYDQASGTLVLNPDM